MLWMAFVATGTFVARPMPSRAADLRAAAHTRTTSTARQRTRLRVSERLGTAAIRLAQRASARPPTPVAPELARRAGGVILAALAPLPVLPLASVPAGAIAWALPAVAARRRRARAHAAIASDMPEVVDLLLLGVGAGLSVRQALEAVARRSRGPLAAHLRTVTADVARGRRLADALDDLPARAGDSVRPLVAALTSAERYGAPLGAALERMAEEVRAVRRRRAEEAARRVPVKLLFPLVGCVLPAFALLTVAPLIAGALKTLRLP
jgi:tight adherence protein C